MPIVKEHPLDFEHAGFGAQGRRREALSSPAERASFRTGNSVIAGRGHQGDGPHLVERCNLCYVGFRLERRAELLLVERNRCDNGLELRHQVRMALGNVLPRRFVFEELGEIPFRKH